MVDTLVLGTSAVRRESSNLSWSTIIMNMKTYYFWVTLPNKAPMKVAEEGRTASEAKNIVEARFPDARVMFAEGF